LFSTGSVFHEDPLFQAPGAEDSQYMKCSARLRGLTSTSGSPECLAPAGPRALPTP
jgi:hypothetical protein